MNFRENYSENDLESAIYNGIDGDSDLIKFSHYGESFDHISLIESLGCNSSKLTRFPKGWAIGRSDKEILESLVSINETISSYWEEILLGFNSRVLPPIIVVNNQLCDGAHRTIICYLFNAPVRIAYFKAPQLD